MIKRTKNIIRLIATVLVASNLFVTGIPSYKINAYADTTTNTSANASEYGLAENIKDGTILHAWCWSFNTIKENMADIAAAGFTTVQTSPANTCVSKYPNMKIMGNDSDGKDGVWWWHYQPTDWKIGNYQLGTRDDFKAMCDEADKYGIKVIVDVIPNHTTPSLDLVSQDLKNAAGGQSNLYHANGFDPIEGSEWNDRYQCTTGQMGGLPDVNTENPGFQKYFLNYLNDCIECGADGFRYDTAKHIGLPSDPTDAKSSRNNFWPVVTGKESVDGVSLEDADRIFNYGEVLQDANVKETEYAQYIGQTASNYGQELRNAIGAKDFSVGRISSYQHPVDPSKLVTWVESHDTYCNDGVSAGLSDWQIRMAWALIAARKDGTPLFYSRPDGSAGWSNRWGNNVLGAKGNDQFKDPEVVAVNKFRNAMVGESEYLRNINGSSQILAIERGNKGEVIINLGDSVSINYDTTLADGQYKDQVSGRTFTVSNGKISGQLDGGKVAVIYNAKSESVSATPGTTTFSTDTLDIKLNASNVSNAKYSIGNQSGSYVSGQTITIGEDMANGESATLTLTGIGADGKTVTSTYTYTKKIKVVDKVGIYFTKPASWGSNINAYVYDEKSGSSVQTISEWPGTAMTSLGNDEYFLELPSSWTCENTQVIFNDGTNQMPASQEPGYEYTLGKAMGYEDGEWSELKVLDDNTVTAGTISTDVAAPQATNTTITISTTEAKGGTGTYTYQFEVNGNVIKSYSSDMTVTWVPSSEGTYTLKVTAKDSEGNTDSKTMSYTISDNNDDDVVEKAGIYFKKPSNWGSNINVYIYDESTGSVEKISSWPGVAMTNLGNDEYFYELPSSWTCENTKVIFNDGTNQLPGSNESGLNYTVGTAMKYEDGNWKQLVIKEKDESVEKAGIYFKKPSNWGSNINVYVYDESTGSVEKVSSWPGVAMTNLGNDEYFYELPSSWTCENTKVIFNDGTNQVPGSNESGLNYTVGTAMKYEDGDWIELTIK